MALTNKLTAIANAIRAKTGGSEELSLDDMVTEIGNISGGAEIPNIVFTSLAYCNYHGFFDWVFQNYLNKMSTQNITEITYFCSDSNIENLSDFIINFDTNNRVFITNMFSGWDKVKQLPTIGNSVSINITSSSIMNLFAGCRNIRYIPESYNKLNFSNLGNQAIQNIFYDCRSIRSIPNNFLEIKIGGTGSSNNLGNYFTYCYCLDEIDGLDIFNSNLSYTRNVFLDTAFSCCCRLKKLTFKTDNGTPLIKNFKNQIINLSKDVGHNGSESSNDPNGMKFTQYNSGISSDKRVFDATSYENLKNDPDWFTPYAAYSRYNHDSAVETINSLPDASAYLATAGGTNTIKFTGNAGSATDGGAISNLTAAEIAVATAKGWTVTLV